MDQKFLYFSVFLSMMIVVVLTQAAYSPVVGAWLPRFIELCACYWIIAAPAQFGMIFAFFIGLLISLVDGSLMGSASIGLSLVAYVLLGNIHTIRQLDGISQSLLLFLLMGIYLAIYRIALSFIGVSTDGFSYLVSAGVSALFWRPFSNGLDRVRFEVGRFL